MPLTPEDALRIPSKYQTYHIRLGRKEGTEHAAGSPCTMWGLLGSLCYFCQQLVPLEQWQPWLSREMRMTSPSVPGNP